MELPRKRGRSTGFVFGAVAEGDEKNGALAFCVRREEFGDVVVEKGEAGGAEPLGVRSKIELAAEDAGFELHSPIAAIAEALKDGAQVRQEKNIHSGIRGQLLSQAQVTCLGAEISLLQALKYATAAVESVSSGREPFDSVDDQVKIIELGSGRVEKIGRHTSSGAVQQGGKLPQSDRAPRKFARGSAPLDNLFDGIARHLRICKRFKGNDWSCWR